MSSITSFNRLGDVTITWDEDNEEAVLKYIEAKLKEGYIFFLIDDKDKDDIQLKATSDLEQIKKENRIKMGTSLTGDKDLDNLIEDNKVDLRRNASSEQSIGQKVTDPKTIAKSNTVAVRRISGG